jgi:hypothetical protein
MANTTSIHDLPLNPSGGGEIHMMASEMQQPPQQQQQNGEHMKLDQTTINQIVSGLQAASVAGITQLPSRDIPRSVEPLTQDPHVQPNYISPPIQKDYIKESETAEEMIRNHERRQDKDKQSEQLYDELQTPVLLAILYFLFQLPILRKLLFQYIPILFSSDGNININGLGFMSVLFGSSYYLLTTLMIRLGN